METKEKIKIFVSSKIKETDDERAVARSTICNLGFEPILSEDFGAMNTGIQEACLDEVENSDIYVGIFWRSYSKATVEEYQKARELNKIRLVYIKHERESEREEDLKTFLRKVKKERACATFNNVIDFSQKLKNDISSEVSKLVKRTQKEKIDAIEYIINEVKKSVEDYTNVAFLRKKLKKTKKLPKLIGYIKNNRELTLFINKGYDEGVRERMRFLVMHKERKVNRPLGVIEIVSTPLPGYGKSAAKVINYSYDAKFWKDLLSKAKNKKNVMLTFRKSYKLEIFQEEIYDDLGRFMRERLQELRSVRIWQRQSS